VILDSPPATVVTDAAILAARASGTLVVVRAQATARQAAARALRALTDVGGRVLGAVLNDVRPSRDGYYTKYQYYYGEPGRSEAARSSAGTGK
jgi:Mrp family chromosome partitioning ATPase